MNPLHFRILGYCAAPLDGPHSIVHCVRPHGHRGAHMEASAICPWDGSNVRPEGEGDRAPVKAHGVWWHVGCKTARDYEASPQGAAA